MKTLSNKTNKANVVSLLNEISGKIMITGVVVTPKTIKFYANEKNELLAPLPSEILVWAKEKGFEMVARPVGKSKIRQEYWEGKTQGVISQWTSYTLK